MPRSASNEPPKYVPQFIAYDTPTAQPVLQCIAYPPGTHRNQRERTVYGWRDITPDQTALECRLLGRSLWFGVDDAYVNSEGRVVSVGGVQRQTGRDGWAVVPAHLRGRGDSRDPNPRRRFRRICSSYSTEPHGRCASIGRCLEHELDDRIASCCGVTL